MDMVHLTLINKVISILELTPSVKTWCEVGRQLQLEQNHFNSEN